MGLRKNAISNFILTSSTVLFPLITFPYITRTLSSQSLGRYFFVDAFTQYFIIFSAVGIPYYGIREIAKIKDKLEARSKLVIELLIIQVTLSIVFSAIFIGLHYFIPSLKNDFGLVKIACLYLLASSFLMEWFYQGIENFAYITIRSLILKTLSVVSIILFVQHPDDYFIYYLLTTLLVVLNAALNSINYIRKYHHKFDESLDFKRHIKPLLVLFSINVSVSVYAILDTIILGLMSDSTNVSRYNVPLKLVKIYWVVVNGAGMVLIPRIASYFINKDLLGIQGLITKSLNIVFLLTIPFTFLCILFPIEILTIVSGSKYIEAAPALQVLSIVPLIISVCNVFGTQFLMPIGAEKNILHATLFGLLASLLLNFTLIPSLGYLGAAISCLVAEAIVCIYIFIAATKRITVDIDYKLVLQIFLSVVIAIISKYFLMKYFQGIMLMGTVILFYIISFALSQIVFFKNQFILSLVKQKV